MIDLNQTGIDAADPVLNGFLSNLQGNILKGHGRDHSVNFFLTFAEAADAGANRIALQGLLRRHPLVSASQQLAQTRRHNSNGEQAFFQTLLVSSAGLAALGWDSDAQRTKLGPASGPFVEGAKALAPSLGDNLSDWDQHFREGTPHLLLILAHSSRSLLPEAGQLKLPAGLRVMTAIEGRAWRNSDKNHIEHFGYVDGRSQPLFFASDIAGESTAPYDPRAPLSLALVPDVFAPVGARDCFGSYFVFRKLEQDVRGFKGQEAKLAGELQLTGGAEERAGAFVVGRFEDGTPVVLHGDEQGPPVRNDFDFSGDATGSKCPFQAHIRKMNPRGETVALGATLEQERSHRIVRRGITYGTREQLDGELLDEPAGGVGLLFMCYQSSIENQFLFMQRAWANQEGFVQSSTGLDPVIGQGAATITHRWPDGYDTAGRKPFGFPSFVTMRGGEFFYAPSLPGLRALAGLPS